MAINPAIALGVESPKPLDMLGAYGSALSLKNLVNQGRAQELQLQQAQRDQDKQMRLSDLARMSGGDMDKFAQGYGAIDPLGAMDYGIKAKQLDMQKRKAALDQAEGFNKLLTGAAFAVKDAGYTQEAYEMERQRLLSQGVPPDMLANLPAQVSPQFIDSAISSGLTAADRLAKERLQWEQNRPQSPLGQLLYDQQREKRDWDANQATQVPNDIAVDPATGATAVKDKMLVQPPPSDYTAAINREKFGDATKPFFYNDRGQVEGRPTVQEFERGKAKDSATNVSVSTGKEGFQNERSLRNDFQALPTVKAHNEVRKAFAQVNSSLAEKTPIGDVAAATKIMKLLDENSVVRESELALAMQASGLMDRFRNLSNMVLNKTISDKQREDFRSLARQFYAESEKVYNQEADRFAEIATSWGLKPDRIIGPRRSAPAGVSDVKTKLGDEGNPYKIRGDDGYNALPSGAFFVGPDGKTRRKP